MRLETRKEVVMATGEEFLYAFALALGCHCE